jgi:dolichol-phosphate mannosyltransferase
MGFPSAQVPFSVPDRATGTSSWGLLRLSRLAIGAITSFSSLPLHTVTALGVFVFLLSLGFGGFALYQKLTGVAVSGFTTVILLLLLIGSTLMLSLGIIGIYIARIYDESKSRPAYLIDSRKSKL